VVTKIVRPLGVTRIRIEAASTTLREKVNIEPSDTGWDALRRAAEANGLWPWFEPDGTLVVGGPRYDEPPVATLVLTLDGKGNNLLALSEDRNLAARYSEVTVLGQSYGTGSGAGERDARAHIKAVVADDGVKVYRPRIVVDHEAVSEEIARARGRKIISDARLQGYTLTAVVKGHRTADGLLWKPGQRVTVKSEPHDIEGVYFLMGRRFVLDRRSGQITHLTLKEDGVWTLDAHPSKRKHRRGKNSLPGKVIDLSAGAAQ
jgi:prophage tail gpP-like protein